MNKKCTFIMLIACILVLGACFSSWRGDEGTINIRIGGENGDSGGRKLTNGQEEPLNSLLKNCFFDIYLTNNRNQEQSVGRLNYGDTASFSVVPGRWKITVKAFTKDDKEYLAAEGTREVVIKPGLNDDITIPMRRPGSETPPEEIIIPIMVTSKSDSDNDEGTLRRAIQTALDSSKESETIVIDLDDPTAANVITLDGTLPEIANKSVTIKAKTEVTIKRDTSSTSPPPSFITSFFTIGNGGTLTLGGASSAKITIDGDNTGTPSSITKPLITIDGGTLIINKDVTLQNNNNLASNGGGVIVDGNGRFTMNGGKISGNTASEGGGVYVKSGTFTMKDGEISDNTATTNSYKGGGGGVYVTNTGAFRMAGGTIYGVDNPALQNKAPDGDGSALYIEFKDAQYGKFDAKGIWTRTDDLETTNDTIKVVNGELIPYP